MFLFGELMIKKLETTINRGRKTCDLNQRKSRYFFNSSAAVCPFFVHILIHVFTLSLLLPSFNWVEK